MRTIEHNMIMAVATQVDWQQDNTEVRYYPNGNYSEVYLFGNLIATALVTGIVPNVPTLIDHPTVTTKSRLRALGVDVYTQRGITHLNGEAI